MKNPRDPSGPLVALAGISLAVLMLAACNQSKTASSAPVSREMVSSVPVFIQFEGPWAFAPDPQDSNSVIAIAPKTTGHRDLFVKASNDQVLASGIYGLSLPTSAGAATLDPGIVQAQISAAGLQHALDAKGTRYAIRLPKPDAYVAAGRWESRVGDAYPPPATTQDNHVTEVSLRYNVSSLTGFTLSGTPDTGTLNPVLLHVETPIVRVVIEPDQMDDPLDACETHSRQSFRDLVKLLGITLYVDFPNYTAACQSNDPQHASNATPSLLHRLNAALSANLLNGNMQTASLAGGDWASALLPGFSIRTVGSPWMAAIYLFAHSTVDCKAAIIVLHF